VKKTATLAAVLAALTFGVLFGGVLRDSSGAAARPAVADAEAFQSSYSTASNTASLVLDLQSRLRVDPADGHSYDLLGLAYQQRARETGDPAYYTKSEGVLRRALTIDGKDPLALSGLAALSLSRHRFRDALAIGRRALALDPHTARHYGVIGDALVELGHYPQAFRAFDTMAQLKPSLSAYARISYARELLGRRKAAIVAMRLAVDAAAGGPEPIAWTHVQLGKLYWAGGDAARAEAEYRTALGYFPGYAYGLDALAQAEAGGGRLRQAIELERQAVDAIPLPQYVGLLGDLYRAAHRPRAASAQYALIGAIEQLLHANGVRTDLETALFRADHGIRLRETLALARAARADRPSIDGDDVLAWTLERNGRCDEALQYSKHALRLGTQDALKFFHRGMIERCLGRNEDARAWFTRALALNPHFSLLWAPVAKAALR
jgi:tetratricopeptide (TPR) repeat protein